MSLGKVQIKGIRLLTFDAFGTLFTPIAPISTQYGDVARRYGLSGFTDRDMAASFRNAFKTENQRNPNYGKATGMNPSEWWANVIHSTFRGITSSSTHLPDDLISDLLTRFSSSQGYDLYSDVLPFFSTLQNIKESPKRKIRLSVPTIGIITNSDDRVPLILSSLGLKVGTLRHGLVNGLNSKSSRNEDISFVILSYDVGVKKPHQAIFDAARVLGLVDSAFRHECLHIGDNIEEDYQGAKDAGWKSLLLTRQGTELPKSIDGLKNLAQLGSAILSEHS